MADLKAKPRSGSGPAQSSLVHTIVDESAEIGARLAREKGTTVEGRAEFSRSFAADARSRSDRLIGRLRKDFAVSG